MPNAALSQTTLWVLLVQQQQVDPVKACCRALLLQVQPNGGCCWHCWSEKQAD
jgi:hypothetical protein